MLYTIAEISELIGLSKVSLYKKLKLKKVEPHIIKKQGITYVDEEGFNLIKESLKLKERVKTELNDNSINEDVNSEVSIDTDTFNLKIDYISTLKEQLKEKDKQIDELHRLVENSQILLKQSQEMQLREDPILLEEHFEELDKKIEDIKIKMENKKNQKKGLFKFFGKEKVR
ncbi:hypothetical protein [Clostridium paridis]|uniref:DUF536 domain-containing protein n=1 Tax=Clostridium paridis TaxID=2803863 RepID=A0A937K2I2_9CLOT|nr:hypothetical protein [Clostridium paridis]MBL4930672.1 hypothetical protein [Clostridium paridis]